MLDGLRTDLLAARRSLFKNPAYSFFAVVCLALGIGATTAVFSVVNAFLLRPLPFAAPSRLISIWMTVEGAGETRYFLDPKALGDLEEISEGFEVSAYQPTNFNIHLAAEPRRVEGVYATSNLFDVLGVALLRGRSFSLEEERAEEKVCIVSEEFWRDELGLRPDVLSSKVHLNGVEYVVVGVAPAHAFPDRARVWTPITRALREGRAGVGLVARLREGVSPSVARQELERSAAYLRQKDPVSNSARGLDAGPLGESLNDQALDDVLWALLGVVGFLLAIACANVSGLLLVRLQKQRPELALIAALGAGRSRLLRRVLIESSLLALLGAGLGIALAVAVTPALVAMSPAQLPRFREMELDLRVLGFAAVLTVSSLLLSSVVPAWRAAAANPSASLNLAGRGGSSSSSSFRRLMLVVNVALTLVLLSGAGLMLNSFSRLRLTDPGFDPANLYRARIVAPASRAQTHGGRAGYVGEVEGRMRALPGVEAVGATHSYPVGGFQYWLAFLLEDRPEQSADQPELGIFQIVTPGYFDAMESRPIVGRTIEDGDVEGRLHVVVVSKAFARRYWPGEDALGHRLRSARNPEEGWWSIVGVVPDHKDRGLTGEIGPSLYFSQRQLDRHYTATMDLFVRVRPGIEGMTSAIRSGIRGVEPAAIVYDVAPMSEVMGETLQRERFSAVLTAILAALALTLAGAGIYGVISYGVGQRRRELGVRLAFGARVGDLKRMVVGQSLEAVLAGVVVGNLGALGLGRLIDSQLYETKPHDPLTLTLASLVIVVTALAAAYVPARRTSKLDPTEALRGGN